MCSDIPQAGPAAAADQFTLHENYVALPPSEAFRIEYWKLEEAKIRRQPPEKELSRRIALVVGGGSGIGREVALLAAERGAHVMVADRDVAGAEAWRRRYDSDCGQRSCRLDEHRYSRPQRRSRLRLAATIRQFGGIDILINTAALFPSSPDGVISDAQWALTLEVNVTANYLLADEAAKIFAEQGIDVSMVLTSSANAVVAKRGARRMTSAKRR